MTPVAILSHLLLSGTLHIGKMEDSNTIPDIYTQQNEEVRIEDNVVEASDDACDDGSVVIKKRRRMTSKVWGHFEMFANPTDGKQRCKCKRCGVQYLCDSKNGTVTHDPELEAVTEDILTFAVNEVEGEAGENSVMDLQNTAFTVQLGRGVNIQLANAVINTGSSGATIQFGSVDFPTVVARTVVTSAYGTDSERPARRPHSAETSARRAHLSAPQVTTTQDPRGRIFVFERLSQSEAPTIKRSMTGGRISVVTANTTNLPTGPSTPGRNNIEVFSSGGRLTRRQRRKMNPELRAQQQVVPVHPSNLPAHELEANVPTRNRFADMRWVKRNSSTGELKKSFWDRQHEVIAPQEKKEPESLSARVYQVLKTVKERGLTKRKIQRPLTVEVRRTPPRERLPLSRRKNKERRIIPYGKHQGVTPELHVRESTAERSRRKEKEIWRSKPQNDKGERRRERIINLAVTSSIASRRPTISNQRHQRWVPKRAHDDTRHDGRHLEKSSKGSHHSPTPPKEETNFDRSPRVEEIFLPNQKPEIQWRRRSEIRVLEVGENIAGREENMEEENVDLNEEGGYIDEEDYMEDEEDYLNEKGGTINEEEMNDTINMEVMYMVRYVNINNGVDYDDGEDDGD
ncbi:hypothetical protein M5K25_022029 [Dendrobium thyrsiflorum]|uniref:Uncharacterized protein n=1 Tax=Dendrobium thyrsiflorum TaxID=117978 RepID=A0ABD0U5Z0_DENTH